MIQDVPYNGGVEPQVRRAADLVQLELERERRAIARELIIERLELELRNCLAGDSKKDDKVQGIVSLVQKLIKLL